MSNLLELLQPKDYKSKLRLFCREIKTEKILPTKVAQEENKPYICRIIKITEI